MNGRASDLDRARERWQSEVVDLAALAATFATYIANECEANVDLPPEGGVRLSYAEEQLLRRHLILACADLERLGEIGARLGLWPAFADWLAAAGAAERRR